MSFFSRIFGGGDPLEAIEKSYREGRWADVLSRAASVAEEKLPVAGRENLHEWVTEASNQLARLNLDEGRACLAADEMHRGIDHLELALELARSPDLKEAVQQELLSLGSRLPADAPPARVAAKSCASSCCDVPSSGGGEVDSADLDEGTRYELILTAYPPTEHDRYLALSQQMRQGILLAHEEEHQAAQAIFSNIAPQEQGDIFHYEYGSLLARLGRYAEAVSHLRESLQKNPTRLLTAVALIDLHLTRNDFDPAEHLLKQIQAAGSMPDYCLARLAFIAQKRGDEDKAFEYGMEALRLGYKETAMNVFVAGVLEKRGRLDEAEAVLQAISTGGGCSGGANIDLAEFWLRHKLKLQSALEMFKKGAKSDPGNPVWGYHIARAYLALGWKKDAVSILETLALSTMVDEDLRRNAATLLKSVP